MPKHLERALKKIAKKRGYDKKRAAAYVYGTINKMKSGGKKKSSKGV